MSRMAMRARRGRIGRTLAQKNFSHSVKQEQSIFSSMATASQARREIFPERPKMIAVDSNDPGGKIARNGGVAWDRLEKREVTSCQNEFGGKRL